MAFLEHCICPVISLLPSVLSAFKNFISSDYQYQRGDIEDLSYIAIYLRLSSSPTQS